MYKHTKKESKYNGENSPGMILNDLTKNSNKNVDGIADGLLTGKDQTRNAGAIIDYILLNNNAVNVMMTSPIGLSLKDISHTVLNIKLVMTGLLKLNMNSLLITE